jgi:hypothetical protein
VGTIQLSNERWPRVWEALGLAPPTLPRFGTQWEWFAWQDWSAYSRSRPLGVFELVERFRDGLEAPPGSEEWQRRLNQFLSRRQLKRPDLRQAALRALELLASIEERCRADRDLEQLAVCLTVRATLVGRVLGREEEADTLLDEAWTLDSGEEAWRVHAAVTFTREFLTREGIS